VTVGLYTGLKNRSVAFVRQLPGPIGNGLNAQGFELATNKPATDDRTKEARDDARSRWLR